jgi:hypothetical protein
MSSEPRTTHAASKRPGPRVPCEGDFCSKQRLGRRLGIGKVGKRAPTLETVAGLLSPEMSAENIHTYMYFSRLFERSSHVTCERCVLDTPETAPREAVQVRTPAR